ncbi:MAG: hypothetical protein EXQ95_06330 [Alphaproteobacteria bacterium]|nr:hypothetical protein [Alphaproteobacteria bacterium]
MTETLDAPATPISLPTWLAIGFVAGFLSVLTFHQGTIGIAHLIGLAPNPPYPMRAVAPLGVPQFISLAFWGGVWLTVFALVSTRLPAAARSGIGLALAGLVFGSLVISTFNWFVLAPLRGQPLGNGFILANMMRSMIYNGVFGLGGALWMLAGMRLLASRR